MQGVCVDKIKKMKTIIKILRYIKSFFVTATAKQVDKTYIIRCRNTNVQIHRIKITGRIEYHRWHIYEILEDYGIRLGSVYIVEID